jgi:hypothetical protein
LFNAVLANEVLTLNREYFASRAVLNGAFMSRAESTAVVKPDGPSVFLFCTPKAAQKRCCFVSAR